MKEIGVFIEYKSAESFPLRVKDALGIGAACCQLAFWDPGLYTEENASIINEVTKKHGFRITALWAGWSGPCRWNFTEGPSTIGLVPEEYREMRAAELLWASEFAEKIGVTDIITHVGFLPGDEKDPMYIGVVAELRRIVGAMHKRGQRFLFETGQEKPGTLLRTIRDIGYTNVGINLDTANLILYGMSSTLDAIDVFGSYVMNTHIKDGRWPTVPGELGVQVKAGKGDANRPAVVRKLYEIGYTGPLTIEREIDGEEQKRDIMETFIYLEDIIAKLQK